MVRSSQNGEMEKEKKREDDSLSVCIWYFCLLFKGAKSERDSTTIDERHTILSIDLSSK